MRAIASACTLALALLGFSGAALAHCSAHGDKGDFETPPPATAAKKPASKG